VALLAAEAADIQLIYNKAAEVKAKYIGNKVYLRGLVEYSNKCRKNCYYCGIRLGNAKVNRYTVDDDEVVQAAKYIKQLGYGSMVLQSGELMTPAFVDAIERLLLRIHAETDNTLGITLSMGEQTEETYSRWFNAGAKRYLLRIESSTKELYYKLHSDDDTHSYDIRLQALHTLQKVGYQVGSGVMIGLPFQTLDHLANDLLFLQNLDVDMVGMGPYIEHSDTPLYQYRHLLPSVEKRLELSLKMVAILRIMMKDINIAATTALQTLRADAREQAVVVGANIIMPNVTPQSFREQYFLYQNKTVVKDDAFAYHEQLEQAINAIGCEIGYNAHGDSRHYAERNK
jgi:biotin synthase